MFQSRAGYLDPRNLKVQAQQSTQDTLRVVRLDHHCFAVGLYVDDPFYVSDYSRGKLGDTANLFACGAGLDLGGGAVEVDAECPREVGAGDRLMNDNYSSRPATIRMTDPSQPLRPFSDN